MFGIASLFALGIAYIVVCGILIRTLRRRMDEQRNEAQAELDDAKETVRKFELSIWNAGEVKEDA